MQLKVNSRIAFYPKMKAGAITSSSNLIPPSFDCRFQPQLIRSTSKTSSFLRRSIEADIAWEVEDEKEDIDAEDVTGSPALVEARCKGEEDIELLELQSHRGELLEITLDGETFVLENEMKKALAAQLNNCVNLMLAKVAKNGGGDFKASSILVRLESRKAEELEQQEVIHKTKDENLIQEMVEEMKKSHEAMGKILLKVKDDSITLKLVTQKDTANTELDKTSNEEKKKKEIEKQDEITKHLYGKLTKMVEKERWYKLLYLGLVVCKRYVLIIAIISGVILHFKVTNAIQPSYIPQMIIEILEWLGGGILSIIFLVNLESLELEGKRLRNEALKRVSSIWEEKEGDEKFIGPEKDKSQQPQEVKAQGPEEQEEGE